MPIYEYECAACGLRKETIQKISDEPLKDCPECGKPEMKKLVSAAAFRLKGGGWYETDFKSGDKKNIAGGDKQAGNKAKQDSKQAADSTTSKSTAKPAGSTATTKKTGSN
jgi:putative FmdB family regulatory protein